MSKAGSVKIKASGAVAPNRDNYESAITYVDGTLTISTKSSGGGVGGGSTPPPSGGSAGGVTTPGKTVIDNPVGNQGSKNTLAEAVKNAIATGITNPTVYTNFANYTALTKDGLKAINDATTAAVAGNNVQLNTLRRQHYYHRQASDQEVICQAKADGEIFGERLRHLRKTKPPPRAPRITLWQDRKWRYSCGRCADRQERQQARPHRHSYQSRG